VNIEERIKNSIMSISVYMSTEYVTNIGIVIMKIDDNNAALFENIFDTVGE
jgi:hypothetical protein